MTNDIEHAITVDAPPDEVWTVLTEDGELATWLGDDVELEAVPGGEGQVVDDDGVIRHIRVEEIDEGRSIRWSWWPESSEGEATTVEITVVPSPEGTEVRVVETAPVMSLNAGDWQERIFDLELELLLVSTPAPQPVLAGIAGSTITY